MLALPLHDLPLRFLAILPHLPRDQYAFAKLLLSVLDEVPFVQIEGDNSATCGIVIARLVELPPIRLNLFGFDILILFLGKLAIDWSSLMAELSWRLALVLGSPMAGPVITSFPLTAYGTHLVYGTFVLLGLSWNSTHLLVLSILCSL